MSLNLVACEPLIPDKHSRNTASLERFKEKVALIRLSDVWAS